MSNTKVKCEVCNKEISKNNYSVHENTIKHQNNVKIKQGENIEVEKLKKIVSFLQNENLTLRYKLNSYITAI